MNNELIAAQREGRIQEAIIIGQNDIINNNKEAISILHEGIDAIEAEHKEDLISLNNIMANQEAVINSQAALIEQMKAELIKSGNNIMAEAEAVAGIKKPILH